MKFFNSKNETIIGIGEIASFLRVDEMAILDLRIGHGLPVRKKTGVFVADKSSLTAWLKCHPDAIKEATTARPPFEIIQRRRVKMRWGLERVETRRVIS